MMSNMVGFKFDSNDKNERLYAFIKFAIMFFDVNREVSITKIQLDPLSFLGISGHVLYLQGSAFVMSDVCR